MKINITPFSIKNPIEITKLDYDHLVKKSNLGWSNSETHLEFLAKLHYLRNGYKIGKISHDKFLKFEDKLIISWWNKNT